MRVLVRSESDEVSLEEKRKNRGMGVGRKSGKDLVLELFVFCTSESVK